MDPGKQVGNGKLLETKNGARLCSAWETSFLGRHVARPSLTSRRGLCFKSTHEALFEVEFMERGCNHAGSLGEATMIDDYYLERCATTARKTPWWHR